MKNLFTILCIFFLNSFHCLFASNKVLFVENKGQVINTEGQVCKDVLFQAESSGMSVYLKKEGLSYVFQSFPEIDKEGEEQTVIKQDAYVKAHRIDLFFVGANVKPRIAPNKETSAKYNFYFPDIKAEGLKAYEEVRLSGIYDSIDVVYYTSKPGNMKYDFIVRPGGDPDEIQLYFLGTDDVSVVDGVLKVNSSMGMITETMPKVYQQINGKVLDVEAAYKINDEGVVGITVGSYNMSYELIIDPWVTFVGGSRYDVAKGLDVDNGGSVTIVGMTNPVLFPVTPGAFQSSFGGGGYDVFVTRFDNSGGIVFSTLLGGGGDEFGNAICSDASGNSYITGKTNTSGLSTAGVVQANRAGNFDVFIGKFDNVGMRVWLTYHGGGAMDEGLAIDIDAAGDIVVGGYTNGGMPVTPGCFQNVYAGNQDGFVLKLNNNGNTRLFSTYLGGNSFENPVQEKVNDIDIDPITGDIAIIGTTASTTFPVSVGNLISSTDNFIARFNTTGARIWATYFGGTSGDYGYGVAFDALGDIVFAGTTFSPSLPGTLGAYQATRNGTYSAYLGKYTSTGTLQWATYFGSISTEGYSVAVDKNNNNVYLGGDVYWSGLPTWSCAFQPVDGGGSISSVPPQPGEDQFIARFDTDGAYKCNTYIGGFGHDDASGGGGSGGNLAMYDGDVFICASSTGSYNVTPGAYQTTFGGGSTDAVIARICGNTCGDNSVATGFIASNDSICAGATTDFINQSNICDTSEVKWHWSFQGATPSFSTEKNPTNIVYTSSGNFSVQLVAETPCGTDSVTLSNYIFVSEPQPSVNVVQNVTCFGMNNGGASVGVLGGIAPFSYSWSPAGGVSNTMSGVPAGNYSVTIADALGCVATTTTTITQPQQLSIQANTLAQAGCSGNAGIVGTTVSGGTPSYTFNWSNAATQASTTGLTPGVYSVTVTDAYGCIATDADTVFTSTSPTLSLVVNGPNSLCAGQSTTLSAVSSGGGTLHNYVWLPSNNTGQMFITQPSVTTTYSVVVTDNCNTTPDTAEHTITVHSLPEVSFVANDSVGCAPLCITFSNTTPNTTSMQWSFGDGNSSFQSPVNHCYNSEGSYNVSLLVTDNNGCSNSFTRSNYINVYPLPLAGFRSSPDRIDLYDPVAFFTNTSVGANWWQWSFGDVANSSSTLQHPSFLYPDTGKFQVTLIAENEYGCYDTSVGYIYVNPVFVTYVPNTFTPNNDGLNDVFNISGVGIENREFLLQIYDRWGELIFSTDDLNKGWDGMVDHRPVQQDAYVWKVHLLTIEGKRYSQAGHVNLIR